MKGRHLLHGLVADTSAGPAAAPPASAPAPMDEDDVNAALADQFGEQDAVVGGLSSGAAQAAQATAAQPGASSSTRSAGGKARVAEHSNVGAEGHEDAHAAVGSRHPAYLNDGPATRIEADGLTLRDFVQRAAAKRNPNAQGRSAMGVGASSEMLGSVIVPRYAGRSWPRPLKTVASGPRPLRRPPPCARGRAPGCPAPRPASAHSPRAPSWLATPG